MKKLLPLIAICFVFAVVVSMRGEISARISPPPSLAREAPQEVVVMPERPGLYVVAAADDPKGDQTDRNEKPQDQSLEKAKAPESEEKSDWRINVWPVQPQDNVQSLPQMNDSNKFTPPDRF